MPLINVVLVLIVIGVGLWLINRFYSHGIQHQDDPERRRGRRRVCLGLAGGGFVVGSNQFPIHAMTVCVYSEDAANAWFQQPLRLVWQRKRSSLFESGGLMGGPA
jgi:hypothetical protein